MRSFDAIVIGVGGMGSAACMHLARRGLRVLGLEQFAVGHDRGSSHGQTRIIRKAYFEHPDYVPLLHRAYEEWAAIERESGKRLFERSGLLLVGRRDGAVIPGVRHAARLHGLAIEEVPASDVPRRFPGFAAPENHVALFEADAGYLRVEACVRTMADLARRHGATVLERTPVRGWRVEGDGVLVRTDGESFAAKRLVVCGGAWAGTLLADLGLPLEVRRKIVLWLKCPADAYRPDAGSPAFCYDLAEGFFYGFPAIDAGEVKVAEHTGGTPVEDPANLDKRLHPGEDESVRRFIGPCLPRVQPTVLRYSVCLYTMTPDENFVIDLHSEHRAVSFAAGFSGHGFKFAAAVGSILADLAVDGQTREPIGFLGVGRMKNVE